LPDGLECRPVQRAAAPVVVMIEMAVEAATVGRTVHHRRHLTGAIHQ
jgi:hypothetical protein